MGFLFLVLVSARSFRPPPFPLTHSITHSLTLSLITHSHSFTHSFTYSSLSFPLTHSITHTLTLTGVPLVPLGLRRFCVAGVAQRALARGRMYALASLWRPSGAIWSPPLLRGRRGPTCIGKGSDVRPGVPLASLWCHWVSAAFAWQAWHNVHWQAVGCTPWCPCGVRLVLPSSSFLPSLSLTLSLIHSLIHLLITFLPFHSLTLSLITHSHSFTHSLTHHLLTHITHLLRTIIANSDVECILRAKNTPIKPDRKWLMTRGEKIQKWFSPNRLRQPCRQ